MTNMFTYMINSNNGKSIMENKTDLKIFLYQRMSVSCRINSLKLVWDEEAKVIMVLFRF